MRIRGGERHDAPWWSTVILAAACALSACQPSAPEPFVPASATVEATERPLSDAEVESTIAMRRQFGLRADEAWIRQLAADPSAQRGVVEFGIPLSPSELADILSRRWDDDLLKRVAGYCESVKEDCAGAYLNVAGSGVMVDIAHNVERHERILRNLIADPGLVTVTDVEWSLSELETFAQRIEREQAWFEQVGAEFIQAIHPINRNAVVVDYKADSDAVGNAIRAHFGAPTWLEPRWVGPPPWDGPRARLRVHVIEANGRPARNIRCELRPEDPRANEGFEDSAFSANANGVCDMKNLPAVPYQLRVIQWVNNDHDEVRKQTRIILPPIGRAVEVVLDGRS